MQTLVSVIHVFTCILLVLVILIQSGKGAEISASFGGSSQTVFGSSGGANFFTRFTAGAAAVFMVTSLVLTLMNSQSRKSLFETNMGSASSAPAAAQSSSATGAANTAPAGTETTGSAPSAPNVEGKASSADSKSASAPVASDTK